MSKQAFVYFMSNASNSTLYVGVTNNLIRRVAEHKGMATPGFTAKYRCTKLVYFESSDYMLGAIEREKQLKNWKREWKDELITKTNPDWRDLASGIGVTDALVQEIAGQARNDAAGKSSASSVSRDSNVPDHSPASYRRTPVSHAPDTEIAGQARNDA